MDHRLWHKRAPQIYPSSIGLSDISTLPTAGVVTDTAITTLTRVLTFVTSPVGTETASLAVTTQTITVANSAELATLTTLPRTSTVVISESRSSSHTSTTSPTSTSTAQSTSSTGVSPTLIVAIVVPIAVILLLSLGAFWFFMRKRHQRLLSTQAEFVMAGATSHRGEKLPSRAGSSGSSSSSRDGPEKKNPTTTITEVGPFDRKSPVSRPTLPKPTFSNNEIGVARPLTSQDSLGPVSPRGSRPGSRNGGYRNFSGPAPSSGPRRVAPTTQHPPRGTSTNQQRSNTADQTRDPSPLYNGSGTPVRSDRAPGPLRSGPMPRSAQQIPQTAWRGPRGPPRPDHGPKPGRGGPSPHPLGFQGRRAASPVALSPTVGAFNGASPISQYSPIIKQGPEDPSALTTAPSTTTLTSTHSRPTPGPSTLKPPKIDSTTSSRATSPLPKDVLSQENLRIARLGLSYANTTSPSTSTRVSRNFSKPMNLASTTTTKQTPAAHSTLYPTSELDPEPSPALSSPRLPPPRGYSPEPLAEAESEAEAEADAEAETAAPHLEAQTPPVDNSIHDAVTVTYAHARKSSIPVPPRAQAVPPHGTSRTSTISAPSDDGYDDIDASSDVSSLHEEGVRTLREGGW